MLETDAASANLPSESVQFSLEPQDQWVTVGAQALPNALKSQNSLHSQHGRPCISTNSPGPLCRRLRNISYQPPSAVAINQITWNDLISTFHEYLPIGQLLHDRIDILITINQNSSDSVRVGSCRKGVANRFIWSFHKKTIIPNTPKW